MEDAATEEFYPELIDTVSRMVSEAVLASPAAMLGSGDRFDVHLRTLLLAIGRAVVVQVLEALDQRLAASHEGRAESRGQLTVTTVLGVLTLACTVLRVGPKRRTVRPLADTFGLRGGGRTVAVERALVAFGSEKAYARAAADFEEHYGIEIGRTSLLRVVERHGDRAEEWLEQRWATELEAYDLPPAERSAADVLFAQLDGGMVPTGEFTTAQRMGRTDVPPDTVVRPREWKEVRVGLTYSPGSVDPTYVARLGDYEEVGDELFAAAVHEGLGPDTLVVATADGGNGLREGLERVFPNMVFILDHAHMVQHLATVATELEPEHTSQWIDTTLDRLWAGEEEAVLKELRTELKRRHIAAPPGTADPAPDLRRFIDYLEDHIDAVSYAAFVENGWPIGSGRVESAHRFLPQARLKIPGATWSKVNVNRILALRVIRQNGWWSDFWDDCSTTAEVA